MLSKSTYLSGKQCLKKLWIERNQRALLPPVSESQQHIFDQGHRIGALAQTLFPGGIDVTPAAYNREGIEAAIAQTAELIAAGQEVIYEAAFQHNGVFCAVDILVRDSAGWKLYEVKSSTAVKDVHTDDIAIQLYILQGCGLTVTDASVVVVDTAYRRNGALDPQRLFRIESVHYDALVSLPGITDRIAELKAALTAPEQPAVDIGMQCHQPYECLLIAHCRAHLPEASIFTLRGLRKRDAYDWYRKGYRALVDLPEDAFSERQALQIRLAKTGATQIDRAAVAAFCAQLRYPLHYLDFETWSSAIPAFDGTGPYTPHIFQYSLHIEASPDAELEHREYLAEPNGRDYRHALLTQLFADLGEEGDIVVYNQSFEQTRLREVAEQFPEFADAVVRATARMVDAMKVFTQGWYESPRFGGSYSIKRVLPVIDPTKGYADLAIQSGDVASILFARHFTAADPTGFAVYRDALLSYCGMDTEGMVGVIRTLREIYSV